MTYEGVQRRAQFDMLVPEDHPDRVLLMDLFISGVAIQAEDWMWDRAIARLEEAKRFVEQMRENALKEFL